jgi:hypothetical protein
VDQNFVNFAAFDSKSASLNNKAAAFNSKAAAFNSKAIIVLFATALFASFAALWLLDPGAYLAIMRQCRANVPAHTRCQ